MTSQPNASGRPAGAAPLAALVQEAERMRGKRVGLILCGGNIDLALALRVLADGHGQAGPDA